LAATSAVVALGLALGVQWLTSVGLGLAAVGAIGRLVIALRRARLERSREVMESSRRLRVSVGLIGEIDATLIGIDRAEQTILPGGGLPEYVARAADVDLREAVGAAFDGRGPWVVVVHGPSKVGKSRSLFEALREYGSTRTVHLVAPVVDAAALKVLLTPGEGLRLHAEAAVLWLDDLEPFLNGGVTWQTLCEWHASGPARTVAATYGGRGSDLVAGSQASGLATVTDEVLQRAREVALPVSTRRWSATGWRRISWRVQRSNGSSAPGATQRATIVVWRASRWCTPRSTGRAAVGPTQ
jgi:hypothetical protein